MKPLFLPLAILLLFLAVGCQPGTESPQTNDAGTHAEDESWAVTAWGDYYEVFAEAGPLIAGEVSTSHTHVTVLDGFPPLREGVVAAVLRDSRDGEQVFRQEQALRDGIFSIELAPPEAGIFDLFFKVESEAGAETIAAGRVRVTAGDSLGGIVELPQYGPHGAESLSPTGEPTSFLKEQQWRTSFATSWVQVGAVHRGVRGPARVRPAAGGEVLLTAPLDGMVSKETRAYVGLDLKQGSTVIQLTPRAGSDRSLAEIEAGLELAQRRLARLEELLALEAASQAEVEQARARVAILEPQLSAVRGDARTPSAEGGPAAKGVGEVSIRAPFSGSIAEVMVIPGQAVSAGDPLARLVKTRPIWIEVALRPAEAAAVNRRPQGLYIKPPGLEEPIGFPAGKLRLISRSPEVDRSTGTVTIILEISGGDQRLRLGTSVEAEILLPREREGIVIPSSAVVDDGGIPVVYLQLDGESFVRQEVRIQARQWSSVLIEGISPGDRLVTQGAAAIRRAAVLSSGPVEGHVH